MRKERPKILPISKADDDHLDIFCMDCEEYVNV